MIFSDWRFWRKDHKAATGLPPDILRWSYTTSSSGTAPYIIEKTFHLPGWSDNAADRLKAAAEGFLKDLNGSLDDPSQKGTPERWAKMMMELTRGHVFKFTTFPNEKKYDEMVIQVGIPFYSLCEHHLIPFFGTVAIGYIPGKELVGLSKLARTVQMFARRLQVQERMTTQIADFLMKELKPKGVGVIIQARHLCMEMRGIEKAGAETTTSCLKGVFLKKEECRKEFLALIK